MSKLSKYQIHFSTVLYLIINFIFIVKYSVRYSLPTVIIILLYFGLFIGFIFLFVRKKDLFTKLNNRFYYFFCIIAASFLLILMLQFDIANIRVSRYAAIQEWLNNFLNGDFPYGSPTNPSSFPMLFIAFIPFKLIGELGLMQILTYLIFSFYLLKKFSSSPSSKWFIQGLLLVSPIYLYEIVTRSELFSNIIFVLIFIYFVSKTDKILEDYKRFIFASLLGGIILSTRMIVLPIYLIFLIYFFRTNLKMLFVLFFSVGIILLLTNLPFYLWEPLTFIEKGPFAIQSIYLPKVVVLFFFVAAIYLGFKMKNEDNLFFVTAAVLFLMVTTSFLFQLNEHSVLELIFKDRFDIAYFIFPLPFILIYLAGIKKLDTDYHDRS